MSFHRKDSAVLGSEIGSQALKKMVQQYLKGPTLVAVKEVFKKVGILFTRKALEKSLPFRIGVVIGFSANKGLTSYVGRKARDFYKTREFDIDDDPHGNRNIFYGTDVMLKVLVAVMFRM